ncbi:hypothetical protein MLD38_020658 [Melastoma candidum]|uniref:Uncharacterized protein n=1 Tax=Melastoma candidum TaxID=119954 RepID=A0ACB9QDR2_9MYRT|nr:hypothetical protein MLD38_020658 [Melastoma candidum]
MNRSMEKILEGLSLARAEKEAFRQTLLRVVAEAAALGDCFDRTRRALEATVETERLASFDRLRDLEEAEQKIRRSIEERARELQSSEMKVGVVNFYFDGTSRDLEVRTEELRGVELLASRRTEL